LASWHFRVAEKASFPRSWTPVLPWAVLTAAAAENLDQRIEYFSKIQSPLSAPGPSGPPVPHTILRSAGYFITIFVLHGLANPPESPQNEGNGPDAKHLHGIPALLHESDPGGGKRGESEPDTGPDGLVGDTHSQGGLTAGEK
jgi:hypothetical protein